MCIRYPRRWRPEKWRYPWAFLLVLQATGHTRRDLRAGRNLNENLDLEVVGQDLLSPRHVEANENLGADRFGHHAAGTQRFCQAVLEVLT